MKKIKTKQTVDAGGMGGGTKTVDVVTSIPDDAPIPEGAELAEDDAK